MRPDDPPPPVLKLPAKGWRPSLWLRPRGGGCVLTDWGRGRMLAAATLNALFVLLNAPLLAVVGARAVAIHPAHPRRPRTPPDLAALLLGFAFILVVQSGIWIGLRFATRTVRRFTVRLDPERRECVARSRMFGFTRHRATFELRGATADVTATTYRPPPVAEWNGARVLLVLLIVFGGPLGWLISFLVARGRGNGNRQAGPVRRRRRGHARAFGRPGPPPRCDHQRRRSRHRRIPRRLGRRDPLVRLAATATSRGPVSPPRGAALPYAGPMSITVLVDVASEAAPLIALAAQLGAARRAPVNVLVVVPGGKTSAGQRLTAAATEAADAENAARPDRSERSERLDRTDSAAAVTVHVIKPGDAPADAALEAVQKHDTALLILGKHEPPRAGDETIDAALFRRARCAVLAIRPGTNASATAPTNDADDPERGSGAVARAAHPRAHRRRPPRLGSAQTRPAAGGHPPRPHRRADRRALRRAPTRPRGPRHRPAPHRQSRAQRAGRAARAGRPAAGADGRRDRRRLPRRHPPRRSKAATTPWSSWAPPTATRRGGRSSARSPTGC